MPLTIRRRLVDRVRQWRKIAYAVCVALVVVATAVVFLSVSSPASSVESASDATFLDPNQTLRLAEELDRLYPQRILGSEDAAGATTWLAEKLLTAGIPSEAVHITTYTAPVGDREMTLRNVAVVLQGAGTETILITAARDTPAENKAGLLSYASATAVLIDLAQVFASRPHEKTLVFLSTEATDSGGIGIDRFLAAYPRATDVSTILSFQSLGKEGAKTLEAGISGPQNTTPGWYVQLTSRVLEKAGLRLSIPGIASQAADHALALAQGDQVAGLTRGIPSLMLRDESVGRPTAMGLATQGAAMERLILSLDNGSETPSDPGTALLFPSGRFLTNKAVRLLAALMLLPAASALLIWLFTSSATPRVALKHLRNLLSFALPVGVLFLLAYILSHVGLIPRYQFQVPTGSGPSTSPRPAATLLLIVFGAIAFIASRHFLGYLRPREPRATTEMAKLWTGFFGLTIGLMLMLLRSPFLLLPCLAAACTWPLATCFAEPVRSEVLWRHRFRSNTPTLLVGLVTPVLLYAYLAVANGVGWTRAWWFLLVQTVSGSYGICGPLGVVFLVASFLVLFSTSRMRVIPIETLDVTDELSLLEPPAPRGRRQRHNPSQPPLSPWH